MGFSIEVQFNEDAADKIRTLRDMLRRAGISGLETDYEYHPHVTLAYFEHGAVETALPAVELVLPQLTVLGLSLNHLGVFPGGAVFLGFAAAPALYDLHALVYQQFREYPGLSPYSVPAMFVPHVTLGEKIPADALGAVSTIVADSVLPLQIVAENLVLATDRPIHVFQLSAAPPQLPQIEQGRGQGIVRTMS